MIETAEKLIEKAYGATNLMLDSIYVKAMKEARNDQGAGREIRQPL